MLLKQKRPSLPITLALENFGKLLIVFPTKVNLLYPLYSTTRTCCLLHLIKQNCSLKVFLTTLILMTWVSLYICIYPSRTTLKQKNISITTKMVTIVTTNLDLWKASGPDSIPLVVLKDCEPEHSYILAELLNMCLKES